LKSSVWGTYQLKNEENEERTMDVKERFKIFTLFITHGNVKEAPQLGFSSRKQFSSANLREYEVPRRLNPFPLHSSPYL